MDWSDNLPASKSPRIELQGPRPTPLKINKESHKIKKPPLAPQPSQALPRQPIIIYQVSPKIIHTTPGDFMNLVQRLTGPSPSSLSSSSSDPYAFSSDTDHKILTDCFNDNTVLNNSTASGAISPAARYATIENAARLSSSLSSSSPSHQAGTTIKLEHRQSVGDMGIVEEIEIGHGLLERPAGVSHGSVLSPGPASLSPIPPNFFSPPSSEPHSFSFIHDLSPVLQANKHYFLEGSFLTSPSNLISPHWFNSPTPSFDLFNNFMDSINKD